MTRHAPTTAGLGDYRLWPAVAAGTLAICLWSGATTRVACAVAASSTALAVLAALVLRRIVGPGRSTDREREVCALAAMVESSADAIVGEALDGAITSWNAAAARLCGYPTDEALGRPSAMLVPPEEQARIASLLEQVRAGEQVVNQETVMLAKDGHRIEVAITLSPIHGAGGTVIGVSTIARDVSESAERWRLASEAQKRAEQERVELCARAEAARAEAESASRAKDEFLAVLSHELRTPLQSMLGWTHLLKGRLDDLGTVRQGLDTIERNIKTQAQLIEDLLDVSRIVAGKMRLERRHVDLVEVVAAALESAAVTADQRKLELSAALEPLSGAVMGDPYRLQQVVSNLLSNALKFTRERGHVAVRLRREGTTAILAIEDSGCGICPELLPHVFDRFRQGEEGGATRRRGGLGLGLAIVRHLVEAHGGTVKADSPGEGQGATFTVRLPLVSEARPALVEQSPEAPRAEGEAGVLDGVRALVVDDDPDACDLIETVLRQEGADVLAVRSARDALEAMGSFHADVLLSDIGMPEVDGYTLLRELRMLERCGGCGHVPALALTAFASGADRERALSVGFEAHLAKPASPKDLALAVARLVDRAA